MILYRIVREQYARDLSGKGGLLSSARWHDHLPVIYTSVNSSTCILEKLVQLLPGEIHHDLVISSLIVPESVESEMLQAEQLPDGWNHYPGPDALKRIGNAWLNGKSSPLLFVPSVIDPFAQNVLINPIHPHAASITIGAINPFTFDDRLHGVRI
jgi:RES domain-containing protein